MAEVEGSRSVPAVTGGAMAGEDSELFPSHSTVMPSEGPGWSNLDDPDLKKSFSKRTPFTRYVSSRRREHMKAASRHRDTTLTPSKTKRGEGWSTSLYPATFLQTRSELRARFMSTAESTPSTTSTRPPLDESTHRSEPATRVSGDLEALAAEGAAWRVGKGGAAGLGDAAKSQLSPRGMGDYGALAHTKRLWVHTGTSWHSGQFPRYIQGFQDVPLIEADLHVNRFRQGQLAERGAEPPFPTHLRRALLPDAHHPPLSPLKPLKPQPPPTETVVVKVRDMWHGARGSTADAGSTVRPPPEEEPRERITFLQHPTPLKQLGRGGEGSPSAGGLPEHHPRSPAFSRFPSRGDGGYSEAYSNPPSMPPGGGSARFAFASDNYDVLASVQGKLSAMASAPHQHDLGASAPGGTQQVILEERMMELMQKRHAELIDTYDVTPQPSRAKIPKEYSYSSSLGPTPSTDRLSTEGSGQWGMGPQKVPGRSSSIRANIPAAASIRTSNYLPRKRISSTAHQAKAPGIGAIPATREGKPSQPSPRAPQPQTEWAVTKGHGRPASPPPDGWAVRTTPGLDIQNSGELPRVSGSRG